MLAAFPVSISLPLEHLIDYAPPTVASERTVWDTILLMNQSQPPLQRVLVIEDWRAVGLFSLEDILQVIESEINLKNSKITEVMKTSVTRLKYSQLQDIKIRLALFIKFKGLPLIIEDEKEKLVAYIAPEAITDFLLEDYKLKVGELENIRKINQENISEFIGSKKSSEVKELESLLYFRQAIENSSEGIIITDLTGNVIYLNPSFIQIFNCTSEELNKSGGLSFLWKDIVKYQQILTTIKQGKSWRSEVEFESNNGKIFYVDIRIDAVKDVTGQIIGMMGIHTNVTEKVQAEKALLLKDKSIEDSSSGVAIFDVRLPFKPIVYSNSEFERVRGNSVLQPLENTNRFIEDINHQINQQLQLYYKSDSVNFTPIIRNYCQDGQEYWYQLHISPIINIKKQVSHYLCIQSDITKHKLTEMSLLLTQEKLKHLLFSSTGVIYSSDIYEDYGVNFISDNIFEMIGYDVDEVLCDSSFWISHIHSEDLSLFITELAKVFVQDKVSIEYRFLHHNGNYIWIYEQSKLAKDYYNNPLEIVGYRIDITERKTLEEELKQALENEKEVNELKSRFISMTSHEFRTPLSTILSSSELLENYRHKWGEDKQIKHFNRIKKAVKHMTSLLDDVLFFGKVEADKIDCNPTNIDLVGFSRQLVEDLQINHENKSNGETDITINFTTSKSSIMGYMDEKILEHILNNLLSNAIKYSNAGKSVYFTIYTEKEQVVFEIQDEGIGIPAEDLPFLFDSFHRCKNVGNIPGTGLGLSIVKKCIDMHDGEINVTSEVGVGTKFTIKFPLINCCKDG